MYECMNVQKCYLEFNKKNLEHLQQCLSVFKIKDAFHKRGPFVKNNLTYRIISSFLRNMNVSKIV